jgi:hypothetical protein
MRICSVAILCLGCILGSAGVRIADAQTASCDAQPWLSPCAPIQISSDGLATLQLIAAKTDLIRSLQTIPDASSLVDFLRLVGRIARVDKTISYTVPLQFMGAYFNVADGLRPRLAQIGWDAIRRDVELHYVSLQTQNRDGTPEGRMFQRLLDTFPSR